MLCSRAESNELIHAYASIIYHSANSDYIIIYYNILTKYDTFIKIKKEVA